MRFILCDIKWAVHWFWTWGYKTFISFTLLRILFHLQPEFMCRRNDQIHLDGKRRVPALTECLHLTEHKEQSVWNICKLLTQPHSLINTETDSHFYLLICCIWWITSWVTNFIWLCGSNPTQSYSGPRTFAGVLKFLLWLQNPQDGYRTLTVVPEHLTLCF